MEEEKEEEEKEEEEKEEEEKEEKEEEYHFVPTASSPDHQDHPIMHWEELSWRIAELEKQEQERRERSKMVPEVRMGPSQRGMRTDEEEDLRKCCVAVATSRSHKQRNLQLCFVNNSDSDDEDEGIQKKVSVGTGRNGCRGSGLKQEVATALRSLRDKLLAEQKEIEHLTSSSTGKWKHLEQQELQESSVQQLSSLRASLQQEVHALSSELVALLLVRDQQRTLQDAMLLDVQDLT
ncbi:uncharacterized protein ACBR49_010242 [Aulostomus maculatus]